MNISVSKHAYKRITQRFPNDFKPLLSRLKSKVLNGDYKPSGDGKYEAETVFDLELVRLIFAFIGGEVHLVTVYKK